MSNVVQLKTKTQAAFEKLKSGMSQINADEKSAEVRDWDTDRHWRTISRCVEQLLKLKGNEHVRLGLKLQLVKLGE